MVRLTYIPEDVVDGVVGLYDRPTCTSAFLSLSLNTLLCCLLALPQPIHISTYLLLFSSFLARLFFRRIVPTIHHQYSYYLFPVPEKGVHLPTYLPSCGPPFFLLFIAQLSISPRTRTKETKDKERTGFQTCAQSSSQRRRPKSRNRRRHPMSTGRARRIGTKRNRNTPLYSRQDQQPGTLQEVQRTEGQEGRRTSIYRFSRSLFFLSPLPYHPLARSPGLSPPTRV
ncbi:hypothetical protein IWX90DRAFT_77805 [Phyllosticta citrichinensis]|uniref:Uncharacterized protein n=1 Tax=Phyllosticta citrichinensis TaxID=1130410 RepID=A0ABR1XGU3_9PEZI